MKKALLIGLKDLIIVARDRTALLLMLAAPFALALGLGLVTGRFSGASETPIEEIPVVIVDQDGQQLSQALVEVFNSADVATLLDPAAESDPAAARAAVDDERAAAAVIIPPGFTDSIIPREDGVPGPVVPIEIYADPARKISSSVVQAVVQQFLARVESGVVAGQVAVSQLLEHNLITPEQAVTVGQNVGLDAAQSNESLVNLATETLSGEDEAREFDVMAILAPGFAVFFLMFTVTNGGRSLLDERTDWTLQRLLTTPTSMTAVLSGKVIGIFLAGFAQMVILILGTTLLFGLYWGDLRAVIALIAATVLGATGWGMLLAALARTPNQVNSIGTALMILFGILGGSFAPSANFPAALQSLRLITPNAWALDGLAVLALGGTMVDVGQTMLALLLMALLLGGVAVFILRHKQVFF